VIRQAGLLQIGLRRRCETFPVFALRCAQVLEKRRLAVSNRLLVGLAVAGIL